MVNWKMLVTSELEASRLQIVACYWMYAGLNDWVMQSVLLGIDVHCGRARSNVPPGGVMLEEHVLTCWRFYKHCQLL